MTESSLWWLTDGTGDGDANGYTQAQHFARYRALLNGNTTNNGGVFSGYLNELAVSGTSSPVTVQTGAAASYGCLYFNDASFTIAIPTPSVSTRVDLIVARVNWSAQTVRVVRVAGTEGAGAPSLTQTPSTTWEIPIARASITTGGTITVTDTREFIGPVHDGSISQAKLGTDTLRTMVIPLTAIPSTTHSNTSYDTGNTEGLAYFDATKLPDGATVKFTCLVGAPGAGTITVGIQTADTGGAGDAASVIAGSELTHTGGAGFTHGVTGDIRSGLTAGPDRYTCLPKTTSAAARVWYAALLVEW